MNNDYYPTADGRKIIFLDHFVTALATVGATVGMTPADQASAGGAAAELHTALADKTAKKAAAQASTATFLIADKAAEDTVRALVRRIKAHANYTAGIGEHLGIVAPTGEPTGEESQRPDLEATSVLSGEVALAFAKIGHTGVEIRSKRGAETEFTFLARDTESPYVDTRANLTAAPETRHYVARFLEKDDLVADWSTALTVTVPGVG